MTGLFFFFQINIFSVFCMGFSLKIIILEKAKERGGGLRALQATSTKFCKKSAENAKLFHKIWPNMADNLVRKGRGLTAGDRRPRGKSG